MAQPLPVTFGDTTSEHTERASPTAEKEKAQVQMPEEAKEPDTAGPYGPQSDGTSSPTTQVAWPADVAHDPFEDYVNEAAEVNAADPMYTYDSNGALIITAENAQSIFSPTACLFVANLDRNRTRMELVDEILKLFTPIGECWAKVRFDSKGIPVAFVQYKTAEEANEADRVLCGTRIFSRPCRIEKARAPRTLFVARKDQRRLTLPFVLNQLRNYGEVEHFWFPSHTERALYNLPDGVFVRFALFQPCQDAIKGLRKDPVHNFTLQPVGERPQAITAAPVVQDIVPNAIYVGDLPLDTSYDEIRGMFEYYGYIISVDLHRIVRKGVCFAFVYFADALSANYATQFPYPYVRGHHYARVEPKRARTQRPLHGPEIYAPAPMALGLPFFRGFPDYAFMPGDPAFQPRYVPDPRFGPWWPYPPY